jgi:hypothetical protein
MNQPEPTHPHTDGTGAGLLGFCAWLGDQGLVTRKETYKLRVAVPRVLEATDGWERLAIRSLDLELATRRFEEAQASSLRPVTRTTYLKRFRQVIRLYLAYLDDPSGFWMSRGRRGPTRASTSPSQDGTAASLVGFCRWLAEQGMVSVGRADQLCQAVRRVLAPDPDWERSAVRRLDVDGLLQRLATATTPPLRLSTLRFYSSSFRKAVRLYLAYLDDPADFHASGTVLTRWRTRTVAAQASVPAARDPAAAPMPTVVYPFPLRGSHTIWLRLPADLTRVEAHRLATFIHALAMDTQPPPDPATAPEAGTASRHPREQEDACPT